MYARARARVCKYLIYSPISRPHHICLSPSPRVRFLFPFLAFVVNVWCQKKAQECLRQHLWHQRPASAKEEDKTRDYKQRFGSIYSILSLFIFVTSEWRHLGAGTKCIPSRHTWAKFLLSRLKDIRKCECRVMPLYIWYSEGKCSCKIRNGFPLAPFWHFEATS